MSHSKLNQPQRGLKLALLLSITMLGCGEIQIESQNRDLILRLCTAISAQDPKIISTISQDLEDLKKNILISKKEFQVFQDIIRVAQNDQWEEARLMAYRLRDNQEPTDADQEKLNMRELPPMKKHGSNRKK